VPETPATARHAAHSNGWLYLNFPGHGEGEELARNAFGSENYGRLAAIKRKFDPTNFFRMNQNVSPS
jgi:FAD/FMN-containing dehydrogenase